MATNGELYTLHSLLEDSTFRSAVCFVPQNAFSTETINGEEYYCLKLKACYTRFDAIGFENNSPLPTKLLVKISSGLGKRFGGHDWTALYGHDICISAENQVLTITDIGTPYNDIEIKELTLSYCEEETGLSLYNLAKYNPAVNFHFNNEKSKPFAILSDNELLTELEEEQLWNLHWICDKAELSKIFQFEATSISEFLSGKTKKISRTKYCPSDPLSAFPWLDELDHDSDKFVVSLYLYDHDFDDNYRSNTGITLVDHYRNLSDDTLLHLRSTNLYDHDSQLPRLEGSCKYDVFFSVQQKQNGTYEITSIVPDRNVGNLLGYLIGQSVYDLIHNPFPYSLNGLNKYLVQESDFVNKNVKLLASDADTIYFWLHDDNAEESCWYSVATDNPRVISFFKEHQNNFYLLINEARKKLAEDNRTEYRNQMSECKGEILSLTAQNTAFSIIGRNMSHNIGSHCLHYTTVELNELSKKDPLHGPEIRGVAQLLTYVKGRMDFLAAMTDYDDLPLAAVNFKSQLLDVIAVDDKNRHEYIGENELCERIAAAIRYGDSSGSDAKLLEDSLADENAEAGEIIDRAKVLLSDLGEALGDSDKDTVNYLLKNIIKSEHFSRSSLETTCNDFEKPFYLLVNFNGEKYRYIDEFGVLQTADSDSDVYRKLAALNLSLPGGTLGCHAFFNIIENLTRNAAKHSSSDLSEPFLTETIDIRTSNNGLIQFTIYDNVHNALKIANQEVLYPLRFEYDGYIEAHYEYDEDGNIISSEDTYISEQDHLTPYEIKGKCTSASFDSESFYSEILGRDTLVNRINSKLSKTEFVDGDGKTNRESKGLKEILIDLLWMRESLNGIKWTEAVDEISNMPSCRYKRAFYTDNEPIIYDFQEKMSKINSLAFSVVAVDENGVDTLDQDKANFGIRFTLPILQTCCYLNQDGTDDSVEKALGKKSLNADIVVLPRTDDDYDVTRYFTRVFIRSQYEGHEEDLLISTVEEQINVDEDTAINACRLISIMSERFSDIDLYNIRLCFGEICDGGSPAKRNTIYFKRHLNVALSAEVEDYLYADAVSGGDFTMTLSDEFRNGLNTSTHKYRTWRDRYFSLKIIESALTRITIIDERIWALNNESLPYKNIRVLNINPNATRAEDAWMGSSFRDGKDSTHFLSIHLGIIEKLLDNRNSWLYAEYDKYVKEYGSDKDIVEYFLKVYLRATFGEKTFISIHSGRGANKDERYSDFPFINYSRLENAFSNSKYLLAQLFYGTIYIGDLKTTTSKE